MRAFFLLSVKRVSAQSPLHTVVVIPQVLHASVSEREREEKVIESEALVGCSQRGLEKKISRIRSGIDGCKKRGVQLKSFTTPVGYIADSDGAVYIVKGDDTVICTRLSKSPPSGYTAIRRIYDSTF